MSVENFIFGSLITSYPDASFSENVREMIDIDSVKLPDDFKRQLHLLVNSENLLLELQSEYIDIFDRGRASNPLYESEYGRNRAMNKGNELADIAGFYHAFGFELDPEGSYRDMIDHVAIELEFYSLLCLKEEYLKEKNDTDGVEIVSHARKKFMNDHLGRFVGAICKRPGVLSSPFYSVTLNWCDELINKECQSLGIEVGQASWIEEASKEDITCGGSDLKNSCL